MAEFSSPISGGIRVARNTVSSSAFSVGRTGGPQVQAPDPTTILLLNRNQLGINAISSQLSTMAGQMRDFGSSLQRIAVYIANDSTLEQQRQVQKQNQERILAEQQLREGKENIVEKRMQSALVAPVQRVAAKAQGVLSGLMGFFTTLLGGWLINQGIETIRALGENNKKKLEEIKNNVVKNLAIVGGVYLAIRTGLFGLVGTASRVVGKIGSAVAGGLFLKPINALIDAVKKAAGKIKIPGLRAAAGVRPPGAGGAVITGTVSTGLNLMSGKPVDESVAAGTGAAVATTGAMALASKLPLPGPIKFGAMLAAPLLTYGPGEEFGVKALNYGKSLFGGKPSEEQTSTPKVAPTAPKTPPAENLKMGETTQDFSEQPKYGQATVTITDEQGKESGSDKNSVTPTTPSVGQTGFPDYSSIFSSSTTTTGKIEPVKTTTATEKASGVGPLPEPKPNVVVAPPPQAQPTSYPGGGGGGEANSVPFISASNPDNFYVLYSQMSYNVVT